MRYLSPERPSAPSSHWWKFFFTDPQRVLPWSRIRDIPSCLAKVMVLLVPRDLIAFSYNLSFSPLRCADRPGQDITRTEDFLWSVGSFEVVAPRWGAPSLCFCSQIYQSNSFSTFSKNAYVPGLDGGRFSFLLARPGMVTDPPFPFEDHSFVAVVLRRA